MKIEQNIKYSDAIRCFKHKNYLFFIVVFLFFTNTHISYSLKLDKRIFPTSLNINSQVRFWENIFSHYSSDKYIIHDIKNPNYIIDIIDFNIWSQKYNNKKFSKVNIRSTISKAYLERYRLAIKRFHKKGKSALKFGKIEQRIYDIYRQSKTSLSKLYQGKIEIRIQSGLADEFLVASRRAQLYLPFMEKTFREKGVPTVITRLAFVESMFNLNARSRVGASGIWQFMPRTAKRFMKINTLVDERNSPYKASIAAAKLLAYNYKSLKSWPLAITAYNHGLAGMNKAIRKVGSNNLGVIIDKYNSSSFRYASKNFYAEFLAAAKVYKKILENNPSLVKIRPTPISKIKLNSQYSMKQILSKTSLDKSQLLKFNPGIRKKTFNRYKNRKLPKNFELFLPGHLKKIFSSSLNIAKEKKYALRK